MSGAKISCNFTPDPKIQPIAEAFANNAVSFSQENLKINLDWSEISIKEVERALAMLHSSYKTTSPPPSDDQVQGMGRIFGSYIGVVYRTHHGAEWGIVDLNGQSMPGLEAKSGGIFWPWAKAYNRITKGEEDNVIWYYTNLIKDDNAPTPNQENSPKSKFSRLRSSIFKKS